MDCFSKISQIVLKLINVNISKNQKYSSDSKKFENHPPEGTVREGTPK